MKVSEEELAYIAHLARLRIHPCEMSGLAEDLTRILSLAEELDTVETTELAPMAHPLDMTQRLRPDVVLESNRRDLLQHGAPEIGNGLYLVPKVIDWHPQ